MYQYNVDLLDQEYKTKQYNDSRKYRSLYWKNKMRKDAISNNYRRTLCEKCNIYFTQSYTNTVYLSNFKYGIVCRDCKKRYNLIEL